jgi:type IV secretory pathway TraG/TraD family ATPase VirD4
MPVPEGVEQLRWSPIQGCQHWDTAVARAWALATAARPGQQLSDAAHWVERAQALLAPLLHAAALTSADLACVLSWLHRRELDQPIDLLGAHQAGIAKDLLNGIAVTEYRERSGIFSTADSLLAAYRTDAALHASRHPNFDAEAFVANTDTLYLCSPGTAQAQHAPLVVALLQHVREAVIRRPQPWPPVIWALDELANIAPLPDLPSVIADSAAQGLLVLASLQDLSQARARWGHAADGFLTLFPTNLILPGIADLPTLQTISAVAGERDITRTSRNVPTWLPGTTAVGSRTTHTETRPRLPVSAIAQGQPGHALLLSGTHPSHLRITPWYKHPAVRQLLQHGTTVSGAPAGRQP